MSKRALGAALAIVAGNLFWGNLFILFVNFAGMEHIDITFLCSMSAGYSATAVFILMMGLRRVGPLWKWWTAALLGVVCSVVVTVFGGGITNIVHELVEGASVLEIPLLFLKGCILGVLSLIVVPPLALGNGIAFILYRRFNGWEHSITTGKGISAGGCV